MYFLSAQSISSIEQIIKSVCLQCQSIGESVSLSHETSWRSTDRNHPPVFTKLVTKVSGSCVYLVTSLVEIQNTHIRQTGSGINFHHCSYGKIDLMSNISKQWQIPRWSQWKSNTKPFLGYRLNFRIKYLEYRERYNARLNGGQALWPLTLDDPSSRSLNYTSYISIMGLETACIGQIHVPWNVFLVTQENNFSVAIALRPCDTRPLIIRENRWRDDIPRNLTQEYRLLGSVNTALAVKQIRRNYIGYIHLLLYSIINENDRNPAVSAILWP